MTNRAISKHIEAVKELIAWSENKGQPEITATAKALQDLLSVYRAQREEELRSVVRRKEWLVVP